MKTLTYLRDREQYHTWLVGDQASALEKTFDVAVIDFQELTSLQRSEL